MTEEPTSDLTLSMENTEQMGSRLSIQNKSRTVSVEPPPHRKLSLFHTCALLVSSVGGAGVFFALSTVMVTTGSVGMLLIIILLCGLLNYSLANCFTEVATCLPKAGGPYFFILNVFGEFPAFLFAWGFVFLIVSPAWALSAYAASLYIVQLAFQECRPPDATVKVLAVWILVSVVVVNCLYMKYVTRLQSVLTSTKLLASIIVIVCGVLSAAKGEVENYKIFFEGSKTDPGSIAISILSGTFLFGGWQMITFLLEEMESPEKNLPKTLSITFTIVISLSELIVTAYFTLISPKEMLTADAVAVLFMRRIYRPLGPVISVLVASTSVSSLNAAIMAQSRLVSAVSKRRHLPLILSTISEKYNMPWAAIIFVCCCSIIMLFLGTLSAVIIIMSFYGTVMALSVLLCLFALRRQRPELHRPVKVWLGTAIIQFIINVMALAFSIYKQPGFFGALVLAILSGIPVYAVFIFWRSRLQFINRTMEKLTIMLQKLLLLKVT